MQHIIGGYFEGSHWVKQHIKEVLFFVSSSPRALARAWVALYWKKERREGREGREGKPLFHGMHKARFACLDAL